MSTPTITPIEHNLRLGCFVSVHVRRPSLKTQLTWKDLGLEEVEGLASAPSAKPPSEAYRKFAKLESRMRTVLSRYTTGSESGFRYMRWEVYEDFIEHIEPIRQQYLDLVEPFLESYETAKKDALEAWRGKGREMAAKLDVDADEFSDRLVRRLILAWPDPDLLRDKFDAQVNVLQFAVPGTEMVREAEEVEEGKAYRKVAAEARARATRTLDGFFQEAQGELRMRAVEIVRRIHSVLVKGDNVSDRNINPLREFVEQFKQLSVVDDSAFQDQLQGLLDAVESRGGAEGLRNSPEAWGEVEALFSETAEVGERLAQEAISRKLDLSNRRFSL